MHLKYLILILLLAFTLKADDTASLLFNGNCITCHKESESKSAPSIMKIQKVYKDAFSEKEEFVGYMSKWVQHPDKKTSLMHDAVKKYGLMPELGFDLDTLNDISTYIYETDFSKRGGRYWSR